MGDEFNIDIDHGFIKPYDVVPTILSILGLPLPKHGDGKPLRIVREITYTTSEDVYDYFTKFRILRRIERFDIEQREKRYYETQKRIWTEFEGIGEIYMRRNKQAAPTKS